VYRLFAPQIQQQLLALQQALKRDLPAVNTAFKTASVATVVAKAAEVRPPAPERAQ